MEVSKKPSKIKTFFNTLAGSAANVGATVAIGGTAGAIGGKAVSCIPTKLKDTDINLQLEDMFYTISRAGKDSPLYTESTGDVLRILKSGVRIQSGQNAISSKASQAQTLYSQTAAAIKQSEKIKAGGRIKKGTEIDVDALQDKVKEVLKGTNDKDLEKSLSLDDMESKLGAYIKKISEKAQKFSQKYDKQYEGFKDKFVSAAKKDAKLMEIAQDGAKHFKKTSIVGAGIAIGVIGALCLNLLNTYGIIGRKKSNTAPNAAPIANAAAAQTAPDTNKV